MRLLSGGKLFYFGQQILLAENVVKGPALYKFGLGFWYHLFLVTENIIKVYKKDFVILFAFCKFIFVYCAFIFLFDNFWKDSVVTKNITKVYKEDLYRFFRSMFVNQTYKTKLS